MGDEGQADSGRNARSQLLSALLLMASVVVLFLAGAEAILRRWLPVGTLLERDSRYFYKYIPGSKKVKEPLPGSGAPSVLVKINKEGRRGEDQRARAATRIIVYGDSFIAAEGTPLENTFVCRLERLLSSRLPQTVQTVNAGVPGYGPDQESLMMENDLNADKPALIVFALYSGNDFGDLIRDKMFGLDASGQLVRLHPVLSQDLNQQFDDAGHQSRFQLARRAKEALKAIRASGIVRRARTLFHGGRDAGRNSPQAAKQPTGSTEFLKLWLTYHEQEYQNTVVKQDKVVYNLFVDSYDDDVNLTPRSEASQYKRRLMEAVMERIQAIAATRAVPLLFLIIPAAYDAVDQWDVSVDSGVFPEYRRSELTDALEQIARKHNMAYVNLFPQFRAHNREDIYFHKGDDHWNARGQQLASEVTADYIVRNQLARTASSAGERAR